MEFVFWKEFEKEFKKLNKKYLSLKEDFDDFCETLELDPTWNNLLSNHIKRISWLWKNVNWNFYKVKKFVCRSISWHSSNSWIRIIYKYEEKSDIIKLESIKFIEIYHKNKKENHDIERIKNTFKI
jgi:mRNA-degrading endonuclease YafQ of YafQ-DinJ toxin-antitoxin module